jgi:hypothetical protein
MPQVQLPLFPAGTTTINEHLAFQCQEGQVVYLNGHLPVFTHAADDLAAFRLFSSQLIVNGTATQSEIVRAFGVPLITVKRSVKKYRQRGAAAFFVPPPPQCGHKLTAEMLARVQALLDEGQELPAISRQTGVLANTIHKAIRAGRLRRGAKKKESPPNAFGVATTQSERRTQAQAAALGCATTRQEERLLAAVGALQGAPLRFERAVDVSCGGVLLALPALLVEGLLRHSRKLFRLPEGFYPLETLFLVLAFVALVRVRSLEGLRYEPPGEWGKLLGLDRIPEVRTMREKLTQLCAPPGVTAQWSSTLAREWMQAQAESEPQSAGVFYADGHVRVYHGHLTNLPRRYVARERLCLRGTTDYWVNAMDGRPFFVVTRPVDAGLLAVLREEIVPRLLAEAPGQPSAEQLAADPLLPRLTLVYDRAGYSPQFFAEMKAQRVAVISYHKFAGADWPAEEFHPHEVTLANGEKLTLSLAERGVCLSNGLWVREVRQREEGGQQVSVLATDYRRDLRRVAVAMFARWSQENFLKYMREHFYLDRLVEYGTEPLPDTTRVVNPAWRRLDSAVRKELGLLNRQQAEFGALLLSARPDPTEMEDWQRKKAALLEAITTRQGRIAELKTQRQNSPKHIELKALPAAERFTRLRAERKQFVDTIKLIAYRAETALLHVVREKLARGDDGRAFLREIFRTTTDLLPDLEQKTLTVRLHPLASRAHDEALRHLAEELTATETVFPGTDLRLIYEIPSSP